MRRRWGLASFLSFMFAVPVASAQTADVVDVTTLPEDAPGPAQVIGQGGLPGGLGTPGAQMLPKGTMSFASLGGFGWREGLLGPNHRFGRTIGNLAFAFAPHELITLALALDGRWDRHYGTGVAGEDGWVGDPRLLIRAGKQSGNIRFGAQLGVWVPGEDAPSVSASAISVDARALVGLDAGPGVLSLNAGFRLDNSAKSAGDMPYLLSAADQVSLGVSEFNAVVAGAHLALPFGKMYLGLEASIDLFIGSGNTPLGATEAHEAPGPLFRGGATFGYHLTPTVTALAFIQAAKVPGLNMSDVAANDIRLVAYEPIVTGGLGFQARFGGPSRRGTVARRDNPEDIVLPVFATLSGEVFDDAGKPVVGAKVNITLRNYTGTDVTDETGTWAVERLPIGKTVKGATTLDDDAAEITVEVDGKKPGKQATKLVAGDNKLERLTLDPILPPGELRGVVRSIASGGKPVSGATIKVEPGNLSATSAADGSFTIELAPGQYKVTVSASGLKEQQLDITIEPNGVALQPIELHK